MKSNIFRKVLKEEYFEVSKSVSKTIEILSDFYISKDNSPLYDAEIYCRCSKKGNITVGIYNPTSRSRSMDNIYPLYYIYGQVLSKDNKTYIHTASVYKKSEIYTQWFWSILTILLFPFIVLSLLQRAQFNIPILIISLLLGFFITINEHGSIANRKRRGLTMLPYMENEIKRCVEIIEQWED